MCFFWKHVETNRLDSWIQERINIEGVEGTHHESQADNLMGMLPTFSRSGETVAFCCTFLSPRALKICVLLVGFITEGLKISVSFCEFHISWSSWKKHPHSIPRADNLIPQKRWCYWSISPSWWLVIDPTPNAMLYPDRSCPYQAPLDTVFCGGSSPIGSRACLSMSMDTHG